MISLSLAEAWHGAPPTPRALIWSYVSPDEWKATRFHVGYVDPVALIHRDGRFVGSPGESDIAIVNRYRPQAQALADSTYLIVDMNAGRIIDGRHRAVAMAQEGVRRALALDLSTEAL